MEHDASNHTGVALTLRLQSGADSAELADEVIVLWKQTEGALVPVLGRRGVAVLFKRSLAVSAAAVPWLAVLDSQSLTEVDIDSLRAACASQPPAVVADGGQALFTAFHELLHSLIGVSLTEQLLSTVRGTHPIDATQDNRP